jgi:glycosyltransferase involved in cell wall biosynthesis
MAQGVPALAGPVPSYREIVTSGVNGMLCATTDDWDAALDAVIGDPPRLAAWSAPAAAAMASYATDVVAARYARFFRSLVGLGS